MSKKPNKSPNTSARIEQINYISQTGHKVCETVLNRTSRTRALIPTRYRQHMTSRPRLCSQPSSRECTLLQGQSPGALSSTRRKSPTKKVGNSKGGAPNTHLRLKRHLPSAETRWVGSKVRPMQTCAYMEQFRCGPHPHPHPHHMQAPPA